MDQLVATLRRALERQRLTEALQRSEERYRLVTESISDAVFLLDLEGRCACGSSGGRRVVLGA